MQRLTEQERYLCRVRAARGHEKGSRVVHQLAVPAGLARIFGQQAQQHAQQRRLAGTNAPGDHSKGATLELQVDLRDPTPAARVPIGQPACAQRLQAMRLCLGHVRHLGQLPAHVHRPVLDQRFHRLALQQLDHTPERDADLLVPGPEPTQHARELGHETQIVHEQGKVADRERAGADRLARQEQNRAGPQVDRVPKDRVKQLVEHAVSDRRHAPGLVQLPEVAQHALLRRRDLYRLCRAEHLADKVGHLARCFAYCLAVLLDALDHQVGQDRHDDQGQKDDQRDAGVDPDHDHHRHQRKGTKGYGKDDLDHKPGKLVDVAAEAADRLAR